MNDGPVITVISPVYRAEGLVSELVRQIVSALEPLAEPFEIILVEDGSPDRSWDEIAAEARRDPRVKGLKLSRNFGQHYAITAGLDASRGEFTVVMDCDLQDDPADIPRLLAKAREGYPIVYTVKERREHSWFKNLTARLYFRVYNYLSETRGHGAMVGAFSMLSRPALEAFLDIREQHRHYLLVLQIIGFQSAYVKTAHRKRPLGSSSYNWSRLIKHSLVGITSQSVKLLRISIKLGFAMVLISVCWAVLIVLLFLMRGAAPGYTSLMAMILLSTGLILTFIGIAGIYIGNIFEQVKGRPLYIVERRLNF